MVRLYPFTDPHERCLAARSRTGKRPGHQLWQDMSGRPPVVAPPDAFQQFEQDTGVVHDGTSDTWYVIFSVELLLSSCLILQTVPAMVRPGSQPASTFNLVIIEGEIDLRSRDQVLEVLPWHETAQLTSTLTSSVGTMARKPTSKYLKETTA